MTSMAKALGGAYVLTDKSTFDPKTNTGDSGFGLYTLDLRGKVIELDVDGALQQYSEKLVDDFVISPEQSFMFEMGFGAGFQQALGFILENSVAQVAVDQYVFDYDGKTFSVDLKSGDVVIWKNGNTLDCRDENLDTVPLDIVPEDDDVDDDDSADV